MQSGVTPQVSSYNAAEGDVGQEANDDRDSAAPSSAGTSHRVAMAQYCMTSDHCTTYHSVMTYHCLTFYLGLACC